jgi:eukaryotic-like serine/threonine-protein kinase
MNALEQTIVAEGDSTHLERGEAATSSSYAPPAATHDGEERSLAGMLRRTPELMKDRSLVIERAVDEFLDLVSSNPELSPRDYSQRFAAFGSSIESSIFRQLEVEQYLGRRQSALDGSGDVRWPSPGEQAGSFEIIEELGRGALARVYLGRQLDVGGRQVVVKVCRSAAGEAHTLGQLRHRNIVPIFTVERDERAQAAILCMPFLGRSTLFDLIDVAWDCGAPATGEVISDAGQIWERPDDQVLPTTGHGPPNPKDSFAECVVYLGVQLADALHHVHAQGVVHGDVKPSNVLLTPEGEPLLMDFNLSGNVALATTARGGTLPYMPPEQVRSIARTDAELPSEYDARSDVFSLGVVLYELLSGRLPFAVEAGASDVPSAAALLLERQKGGCPLLHSVNGAIPRSLAKTIERCLAWAPDRRFQSALDLRDALQSELKPLRQLGRRALAHRRAAGRVAAGALVAVACWLAYAAALGPAETRAYERGLELQQAGDFDGAAIQFSRALELAPQFREAKFELGRTLIEQQDSRSACTLFFELTKARRDPKCDAYVAYCQSRVGRHDIAIPWYERAFAGGFDSGALHNNLAVAHDEGNNYLGQNERLQRIEHELELAFQALPASPTVKLNWIIYEIRRRRETGAPISPRAMKYLEELVDSHPRCGDVYVRAAELYCVGFADDPQKLASAVQFLQQAFALGQAPPKDVLLEFPRWRTLRDRPDFQELVAAIDAEPRRKRSGVSIPRILEPTASQEPVVLPAAKS